MNNNKIIKNDIGVKTYDFDQYYGMVEDRYGYGNYVMADEYKTLQAENSTLRNVINAQKGLWEQDINKYSDMMDVIDAVMSDKNTMISSANLCKLNAAYAKAKEAK